jgi:hypothetical protein
MGEWSDFFEDFPEENPANWINGVFVGPDGAQLHRDHQLKVDAARRNSKAEQDRINSTIARIIAEGKERQRLKNGG